MAKRNFLGTFGIDWDVANSLPPIDSLETAAEKRDFQSTLSQVTAALRCFAPMSIYVNDALRKAKPELHNPTIRWSRIYLSAAPKDQPYFEPKANLYVDLPINPLDLIDMVRDQKTTGALAVSFAKMGLDKFANWPNFPIEICLDALTEFENAKYAYTWDLKNAAIPRTGARIRVFAHMHAAATTCTIEVSREGETLFSAKVWEATGVNWDLAHRFGSVQVTDDHLIVGNKNDRIVSAFSVSLDDLPEDVRNILSKMAKALPPT